MLNHLTGLEISVLLDITSSLSIYTVNRFDDDDENPPSSSYLALPDQLFLHLVSLIIWSDSYMNCTERLECFLKKLFSRTPNLKSIEIISAGSGDDFDDILYVLNCIEKSSMSIINCKFQVKADYNESRMKYVIFHLPMLKSLIIRIIYEIEHFIDIVNICLIYSKHIDILFGVKRTIGVFRRQIRN